MATRDVVSLVSSTVVVLVNEPNLMRAYNCFLIFEIMLMQSGGGRYNVQTGRRDGLVSLAQNTISLPPPTASVATAIQLFALKGLTATDMIYLFGNSP